MRVDWSDVWAGAVVTAVLFWLGQWLLGLYLAWSQPERPMARPVRCALVLLWICYSAMIFFLGAEFTQVLARHRGKYLLQSACDRQADYSSDSAPRRTRRELIVPVKTLACRRSTTRGRPE